MHKFCGSDLQDTMRVLACLQANTGYTPKYAGLQPVWARYHEPGWLIVGVPSNDFGGLEPGDSH